MTGVAGSDPGSWVRADRTHHLHPYSETAAPSRPVEVVVRAEGAYVHDAEGRRYFDGAAGLWCVNVGYGRCEIAEAMSRQVMELSYGSTFGSSTTPATAMLAEALAQRAPGSLEQVFFSTGGSLANESAVRIAHYYFRCLGRSDKRRVIALHDAYHGSTLLTASLTGIDRYRTALPTLDDIVIHIPATVDALERALLEAGPETVACMIMEPVQGAGGVNLLPDGFHGAVTEVCRRHDVLVIADEVVTGFGRLGRLFCSADVFGFEPDILTVGKGVTSGYFPLAATLVSSEIAGVLASRPGGALLAHGFTYSGHPVGCAAALANLAILEREDLCAHVRGVGPAFQAGLRDLLRVPGVRDVRGSHFMAAVELHDERMVEREIERCLARGLIVRPLGANLILSPPLVMSEEQARWVVETLAESIRDGQSAGE